MSRFAIVTGQPLWRGAPGTRKLIIKQYAKFAAGWWLSVALYALGKAEDDDTPMLEGNPLSSDFGKIRYGNARIDISAGMAQPIVFMTRILSSQRKNAAGDIVSINADEAPFGQDTHGSIMLRFFRSKLSPAFGAIWNSMTGKNVVGEETTVAEEVLGLAVPLAWKDMVQALEDQGIPRGTALSIMAIWGEGMQVYEQRETRRKVRSGRTSRKTGRR